MKNEDRTARTEPAEKYNSTTVSGIVFVALYTLIAFLLGGTEIWMIETIDNNR